MEDRTYSFANPNAEGVPIQKPKDHFKDEIEKIKSNLIATLIMEYTRRLDSKVKDEMRQFCEKILFRQVYHHNKDGDFQSSKDNIIRDLKS